jgi:large subunit ribosomal protein L13
MEIKIVDGENAIVGRIGSYAAKELLRGNSVIIVNAEKAIISGNHKQIIERIKNWRKKGGSSTRGPWVSKMPDMLLKRMIRGMLPWDRPRGRAVFKNLKCYVGNPENKEALKLNHKKPFKHITIKQVSELI